ncbi:hypothetical protein DFH28DRAFT_944806 [Melampsora americana]|nr:hypothetical protein DFH28DRAFT_944806 [Melampsora americana]
MPPTSRAHPHLTHRHIGPASTPSIDASLSRSTSPDRDFRNQISSGNHSTLHEPKKINETIEHPSSHKSGELHQAHIFENTLQTEPIPSMMTVGVSLLITSAILWIFGFWILFTHPNPRESASTSNWIKTLASDNYYKYLFPLQFTLGLVFVIVNWGGLKIFRHS